MVVCKGILQGIMETAAPCKAFFVTEEEGISQKLQGLLNDVVPVIADYAEQQQFTGSVGNLAVPVSHQKNTTIVILLGLGKKNAQGEYNFETYRRAIGSLIKMMQKLRFKEAAFALPVELFSNLPISYLAQQTSTIATMSAYRFDDFISDESNKVNKDLTLQVSVPQELLSKVQAGFEEGAIIGQAVNNTRLWIDTPPSHMTPTILAGKAEIIAKKHGMKITVFDEAQVKKMGMGGLAGVSAGSDQECRFVVLEYKAADPKAPTVAFVGKGITFDSGGLSIKPAANMEAMKDDMSGAAAVISAMDVIAHIKPNVHVIAFAPMSENLPSGKATMPGDILTFYNGKTAEVKNTDAEGRLILADALSYAVKHYKPDAIIDVATLTGACAHALGPFYTGIMGKDAALLKRVEEASKCSGDRVWQLPFHDDYKVAIRSAVADMCNIGSSRYYAGAITAGFFLQNFVDDIPWVHLDIAGTAFNVPDISYYEGEQATGVGVRLLIELARNWA